MKKTFLLSVVIFCTLNMYAEEFEVNGIYYNTIDEYNVEVVPHRVTIGGRPPKYENYGGLVTADLPSVVTHNGVEYNLVSIGENAFDGCTTLTTIYIPNSVTSIGAAAFANCPSLTSVVWNAKRCADFTYSSSPFYENRSQITSFVFDNEVEYIPAYICYRMDSLMSVTIPNSVTSIGNAAFQGCSGLTSITIPNSVTSIGDGAFSTCTSLTSITIPNSVTNVGEGAFSTCTSLTTITLPDGVLSINDWTFSGCTQLTSVKMGENVTSVGKYAFENCQSLSAITLPNKVQNIGQYAFTKCTALTSITIPENVTNISWNILSYCKALSSIIVSDQNTTFDSRNNCNAIIETATNTIIATCTQSTIPTTVTSIGDCAFYGRADLTHITIPDQITTIGIAAFRDCKSLESVVAGDNLKIIDESAFLSCTAMTSFSIGKGIESIMRSAFMDCGKLETFICNAVTPPATQWVTFDVSPTAVLYVPEQSVDLYKSDNQWNQFNKIWPLGYSNKDKWCDKWNTLYYNQNKTPVAQTWQYTLGQDTIIEGQTYTIVNRHWTIDPENTEEYVASVRFANNDKVYVYYDNAEYLLYDFTVQEGDSVEVFAGINDYHYAKTYKGRVFDISYSENGAKVYKISVPISTYDDGYVSGGTYREVTWIEGIGNALTGLLIGSATEASNEYIYNLLCAYKGDELMLETDHYWFDIYGCEYNSDTYEPRFFEGLQRTECSLHTTGVDSTYLVSCDSFVRYIIKDILYWYDIYSGNFFRETPDQILLCNPREGTEEQVIYDFSLEVGDTLPVMQYDEKTRGEIFRVVDVSMVTLLDGKEYKKWTLACGYEYIEKIGAINGKGLGNYIGIGPYTDLATYIGSPLVCATRNGQLLYKMDGAEMESLGTECLCEYNNGPKKDNAKDGKIGGRPTPTQWNMLEMVVREIENNKTILQAETFSYTLEDNSRTANNKTYFDLARQSTRDTATTKSVVGALHFGKDEDNRVYFLRDGHEYVLYDFTAEPGDTLEIFAGINNYPQDSTYTHIVTSKDTIENGACRMILEVVFPNQTGGPNLQKVWLAGLGSVDGIVHNAAKQTSNVHAAPARSACSGDTQTSVMLCAWREDSCLYMTDHSDYDNLGCVYNQDPTSVEDSPVVKTNYQKFLRNGQLFILHEGKVYNMLGISIQP